MADDREFVDIELVADVTTECTGRTPDTERAIPFIIDKPPELGGTDRGPMPSEALLGALASCTLFTARRIAAKRRVAQDGLSCRGTMRFANGDIAGIDLEFHIRSDADEQAWETVFRLAEKTCTISRAVSVPITHQLRIQAPEN